MSEQIGSAKLMKFKCPKRGGGCGGDIGVDKRHGAVVALDIIITRVYIYAAAAAEKRDNVEL